MNKEKKSVKVWYNVPMTMRDGAVLYADVYRPDDDEKYPAILNRTPYLKDSDGVLTSYYHPLEIAGRGYNVVIQDVRGAGWSDGVIDPGGNQVEDGYDTVEWLAAQEWCDGNVGMLGESYHGFSQLAAAQGKPPHLKAICPFMTSWTKFPAIYSFGVFSNVLYGWIYGQAFKRKQYFPDVIDQKTIDKMHECEKDADRQLRWLPMKDMPVANVPGVPGLDFQRNLLENIDNQAYLSEIGRAEGFDKVEVPCLNLTGWYDFLRDKTIYNYTQFRIRGGTDLCRENSKMIVGPWNHGDRLPGEIEGVNFGPQGSGEGIHITDIMVKWFDRWLKGLDNDFVSGAPVKLFILGDNVWRDENEWPLARTNYLPYYLHSKGHANTLDGNGILSAEKPENERCDEYLYDPSNPCNSGTGDPHHFLIQDQRPNERREDVLVYTTAPFEKEVEITGPITVEFYASSSAVDTDFVCKVSDVYPDGAAYSLGMKLIRARYRNGDEAEFLTPEKVYKFTVEAANIAMKLKSGHAIRLDITSSLFPDADRNLNTGGRVGYESEFKVAHQSIFHSKDYPSCLILPFIPD